MTSLPRFSVKNPVLVNLLTWAMLAGGLYAGFTLVREMFPESDPERILVTTVYPGATPAEIEKGIAIKIEEVVKDIEEVEELLTSIAEGFCTITLVLYSDVDDVDQVVNDVKASIDTIPREDFPEEAEETHVTKLEPKLPVIQVSFFGDLSEETLKQIGERIRDDLLLIPGITDAILQGTRPDEISVEVQPERLVKYGLSLPDISDAIRRANLDLPGGQIRTAGANVSVRTLGEEDQAQPIGEIIVRSDPSGKTVRLHEIAEVRDTFEETDVVGRFNAKPGVGVTVFKTGDQDAIDISQKVKAFVAGKTGKPLQRDWLAKLKHRLGLPDEVEQVYQTALNDPYPPVGELTTATNLARFIEGRLDLLKRNGFWGLIFVFMSLLIFLNWRVAFWVMAGLLLAILGTLIVMKGLGVSLNLISMFGMIVVLGLLVDDAIIVAEHTYSRIEDGMEPHEAAIVGAETVTWPVVCAITTTIVAFAPLLLIEGRVGDFMGVLPIIVMCALAVSLIEALSVLPSHLAEWVKPVHVSADHGPTTSAGRWRERLRAFRRATLKGAVLKGYERLLRLAVSYRYGTICILVSILIVALGLVGGGRVPFVFFQKMDSETIVAEMEMPVGTPVERTGEAISVIEQAAVDLPELDSLYTSMGVKYDMEGGIASVSSHLGQAVIELNPIEERDRNSEQILRELRAKTGNIPGVNSLRYSVIHGGMGGAPIHIEVSGKRIADLVEVAGRIKDRLTDYAGVYDIDDDFDAGRREVQIELLDTARALNMTTQSLATQVRGAFYGLEARKVQRGREDVKIMVRYPRSRRTKVSDVEKMWVAAGDGTLVPFTEVAQLREGRSYATIKRKDQKRTVTITADVDEAVANARMINQELEAEFPKWERQFPGMRLEFGGQSREFTKSFSSLKRDFVIAAALIYVILAGMFKSYIQPMIVMTAIPFGIIGAIAGHWLMGYPLTILSLIGFVALTGIVVNDSLILVDWINRMRRQGLSPHEAVISAGTQRLRAILLTTITTILGLAPLLLETSLQARFLIPMGISIAAGVAFATVVTLIAVPSLYLILIDVRRAFRSLVGLAGFLPASPERGNVAAEAGK